MARVATAWILLLALPVCGQFRPLSEAGPKQYGTLMLTVADLNRALDEYADTLPLYEWVTVEVDSANVGLDDCHPSDTEMGAKPGEYVVWSPDLLPDHIWVYGPDHCRESIPGPGNYVTLSSPPCLPGADLRRERICRHCLRHEWQERREMPTPPSPFDSLKARLK